MSTSTVPAEALAFMQNARADPDDRTNLLVAADWYCEHGDVLREEWCRCTVDVAQASPCAWVDAGGPSCERWIADGEKGRCTACHATRRLTARLRDLEAALAPAWPCNYGCKGTGRLPSIDGSRETAPECPACGGSGDVLRTGDGLVTHHDAEGRYTHSEPASKSYPLTFAAGHVVGVTLPRLVDAVMESVAFENGCPDCDSYGENPVTGVRCPTCRGTGARGTIHGLHPTPRLRALCSPPPWGVPLAWVFAGDREPYWNGAGYVWYNASVPQAGRPEGCELPTPIFTALEGWTPDKTPGDRWRPYPTALAARRALAAAIVAFGMRAA